MDTFQNGMAPALRHSTSLTLHVRSPAHSPPYAAPGSYPPELQGCIAIANDILARASAMEAAKTAGVCHDAVSIKLAAALPGLQQLHMTGGCGAASLKAFGCHCLHLHNLRIEIHSVPILSLQGMSQALPNLTKLTLSSCADASEEAMQTYVDDVCRLVHGCSSLQILDLDLKSTIGGAAQEDFNHMLLAMPHWWERMPASLVDVRCNIFVQWVGLGSSAFFSRVRFLTLAELPCESLPTLLLLAPCLEKLTILSTGIVELMWGVATSPADQTRLLARLHGGFQLSCLQVGIKGSSNAVAELLTWLPPLPDAELCDITLLGTSHTSCLGHVARVFPRLRHLLLGDDSSFSDPPHLEESFLDPLVACGSLEGMRICFRLKHTHAGLVGLCSRLPVLDMMCHLPCAEVCFDSVRSELALTNRNVFFDEMSK